MSDERATTKTRFFPAGIDLDSLSNKVKKACGPSVTGAIAGWIRIRNEVARELGCPPSEADCLLATMMARGYLVKHRGAGGLVRWAFIDIEDPECDG